MIPYRPHVHGPEGGNQYPVGSRASNVPSACSQSSANARQPLPFSRLYCSLCSSATQTCRIFSQTATAWPTTVETVHRVSQFATKDARSVRAPSPLSTRSICITPPVWPHHNRTSIPRPPRRPAGAQATPATTGGFNPGSTRRRRRCSRCMSATTQG